MVALWKSQKLKAGLAAAGWLAVDACSAPFTSGQPAATRRMATTYVTTTAQLRSHYLPDSVFQLTGLRVLSVSGADCDYRVLDDNGRDVTNCWTLRELPAAVKNLRELQELQLPLNTLARLPAELAALEHLRLLDLTDNAGLRDIEVITSLPQLQELYLYGCNLEKLPANIDNLKKLRTLGLVGNNLSPSEQARIKQALPGCQILF